MVGKLNCHNVSTVVLCYHKVSNSCLKWTFQFVHNMIEKCLKILLIFWLNACFDLASYIPALVWPGYKASFNHFTQFDTTWWKEQTSFAKWRKCKTKPTISSHSRSKVSKECSSLLAFSSLWSSSLSQLKYTRVMCRAFVTSSPFPLAWSSINSPSQWTVVCGHFHKRGWYRDVRWVGVAMCGKPLCFSFAWVLKWGVWAPHAPPVSAPAVMWLCHYWWSPCRFVGAMHVSCGSIKIGSGHFHYENWGQNLVLELMRKDGGPLYCWHAQSMKWKQLHSGNGLPWCMHEVHFLTWSVPEKG